MGGWTQRFLLCSLRVHRILPRRQRLASLDASARSMDSDEELEAALVASMEHAPEAKQRQVDADAELASTLQQQEFDAADAPRPAPRISPSRQCLVLQLPVELQRRCLRFVSIANLITGVRMVCKSFSSQAVEEARERVRALLHDALVSGFEAEAKAEAKAAAAAAEKSDATDVVTAGGTSTISSSSATVAAPVGGSDTPRECTRRAPPNKQRLMVLAEAVESALVRHVAASSGAGGSSSGSGGSGSGGGGSSSASGGAALRRFRRSLFAVAAGRVAADVDVRTC